MRAIKLTFQTKRGKTVWSVIFIVALFIFASLVNYPRYYNEAVDYVNPKISQANISLPKFPVVPFKLGLDLVGGSQLLYDADTSKIPESDRAAALEGVRDVIERRVNSFGVAEPVVQTDRSGDQWRVLVELAGVVDVQDAIRQIGETPLLEFKELDPNGPEEPELTPEQQEQLDSENADRLQTARDIIKRITNGEDFGELAREFSEDPGSAVNGGDLGYIQRGLFVPEFEEAIFDDLSVGEMTQTPVETQFGYHIIQKIDERTNDDGIVEVDSRHILITTKSASDIIPPDPNSGWINTELSGKQLESAQVVFSGSQQQGGLNVPQVSLNFNDEGAKLFEEITSRNVGKNVGIFLDGSPISIPTVQQAITGGSAVITGSFTIEEAQLLAQRLNAGALPVPITLVSEQTVGPSLGAESVQSSLRASLVGFALVVLFMLLYYRLPGFVSVLALAFYGSIVLAIYKIGIPPILPPVTLTLAGATGFILSLGMAVDANILIFERMKEELRAGRPLGSAVDKGFKRAWTSIRDSNVSSLITVAILYWFGTSVVRGFALTLGIGILVSMFSAITVSRQLLRLFVRDGSVGSWWWGEKQRIK
jgi:protein-export membrane protein SecD